MSTVENGFRESAEKSSVKVEADNWALADNVIENIYRIACEKAEKAAEQNLNDADDPEEYMDMWVGMYENSINSLVILESKQPSENILKEAIRELAYARTYARYIVEMNGEKMHEQGHELLTDIFKSRAQMKELVQPLTQETLPVLVANNISPEQQLFLLQLDWSINQVTGVNNAAEQPRILQ